MATIVHLTDMHFGAGTHNRIDIACVQKYLIDFIIGLKEPPIFVVSGDITFQAQEAGYKDATNFFTTIISETKLDQKRFIFCPGNHDIQQGSTPFKGFEAFCYSIRKDNQFNFANQNTIQLTIDDIDFIVTNSSYHRNHMYGLIDSVSLAEAFKSGFPASAQHRFAITHHHLISIRENDTSVTRNAYDYLSLLDMNRVSAILHGHQHFNIAFPVGKSQMTIHGASSFSYAENGLVNGLNVYFTNGQSLEFARYALLIDQPVAGKTGFVIVGERQTIK